MNKAYQLALQEVGVKEIVGAKHNPRVVAYFDEVGHSWVNDDETPWCAAFVGAMLKRAGMKHTGKLNARSYLDIGEKVQLTDARIGDVVIFSRGTSAWQGHVGFYAGETAKSIRVLSGNQKNEVNISLYAKSNLLGVRRIAEPVRAVPVPKPQTGFIAALLQLLANLGKRA